MWNGVRSKLCLMLNGVKQRWVISVVLYRIYLDGLLCKLSDADFWRYIGKISLVRLRTLMNFSACVNG